MDAVEKDAWEEEAFNAVQRALNSLTYSLGRRLEDAGLLGDPEHSWVVSNEIRRVLASAADDPEPFSIHADWFTLGNVVRG